MAELEVDIAALRDMAGNLKELKREFETQDVRVAGYADAVGSDEIAGALEEFANNWSDQREEIGEMLQEVAGYAMIAVEAYTEVENVLKANFEDSAAASASHPR